MSTNKGKLFEQQVKKSCSKDGLLYINLADSNKFGFGTKTRFTPDSPFDCVVYNGKQLWCMELKTTSGSSVSFNQPPTTDIKGKTKMIKGHQIRSLLSYNDFPNTVSGLLIDYQDRTMKNSAICGSCYFIPIQKFIDWTTVCGKTSINANDAKEIGTKVNRKKLRINYLYDIKGLMEGEKKNEN